MNKHRSTPQMLVVFIALAMLMLLVYTVAAKGGQRAQATTAEMQKFAAAKGCPWAEYEEGCRQCHKEGRQ